MPTIKDALIRYLLIDFRLREKPHPGLDEIKSFLEEKFSEITNEKMLFTKLTVKKDLKDMRKIFFAPIQFSFNENHYCYSLAGYSFIQLPDNILDRLTYFLKLQYLLGAKFNNGFVDFDTSYQILGFDRLPILSKALSLKKVVSFNYKSENSKRNREYTIHPYNIREYRNILYLIGAMDKGKEIRMFELDRIVSTPITGNRDAEIPKNFNADKYFADIINSMVKDKKPMEITLCFKPDIGVSVLKKPLHKSQNLVREDKTEVVIEITVEPNAEIISTILGYGNAVRVLSPDTFMNIIAERLKAAYTRYLTVYRKL